MHNDPSFIGGFLELVQQEISMTILNEQQAFEDIIMVRIFKSKNDYKVEMTSEVNVSFLYIMHINDKIYASMN
jgi:hypothetical protein